MQGQEPKTHLAVQELLYLEPDNELTAVEAKVVEAHIARCAECRSVRGEIAALDSLLTASRIEAHPDLASRVMDNLPPALWAMRRPGSWRAAAAVFVGLLGIAYVLTSQGQQPLGEALPWVATLTAMAELLRSAALAGAGLMSASWAGVGLALGDILSRSPFGFAMFGLFVLGVDVLFLRYVWRLSRREAKAEARRR